MLHGVSRVSTLSHPDLHVTQTQAGHQVRELSVIAGVGPSTHLGVFNADIRTLECALLERMYFAKVEGKFVAAPVPRRGLVQERLRKFKSLLVRKTHHVQTWSLEEVVDSYKGRKLRIYQAAKMNIDQRGLRRRDAVSVAFVKLEKCKLSGAPRCIQPRSSEYNVVLGQFIKPVEHAIYQGIRRVFGDGPTVMKGFDVTAIARIAKAKWDSVDDCIAIGLDAVKFDMHVSEPLLEWEHKTYESVLDLQGAEQSLFRRLCQWQRHNEGRGYCEDGKLKYKVKGKRFSGDMNTACGNCLDMCAMVWSYADSKGITVRLINNGDDCTVFMSRKDEDTFREGLSEWFLDMGFRMTVEPTAYQFEQLEFCQMHPVNTNRGWTMVRNIGTVLVKDAICMLPVDKEIAMRKWMYAIGECGLALSSGVPILQSFYQAYMRCGCPLGQIANAVQMESGMRMLRKELESKADIIVPEARLSVYIAWGITPDEQVAIEKYFDRWTYEHAPVDIGYTPTLFHGIRLSW